MLVGAPVVQKPLQRLEPARSEDGLGVEAGTQIHVTRAELRRVQAAGVCGIADQKQQERRHIDLLVLVLLARVRTFPPRPLEVEDRSQHRMVRPGVVHVDRPERFPARSRTREVHGLGHGHTVVGWLIGTSVRRSRSGHTQLDRLLRWDRALLRWGRAGGVVARLPWAHGVGQVRHPRRRLRTDRLQRDPGRVHAVEQAGAGAEEHR